MDKLEEDVWKCYKDTDKKRRKYKGNIMGVNLAVSVIYPLTSFAIAMSFLDQIRVSMHILGLLASLTGAVIPLVARGLAWDEKFQQRTATYLKLDELLRDMQYEKSVNEESFDKYLERYKAIVREDNAMGFANAQIMAAHLEKIQKEFEEKQGTHNGEKG